MNKVQLEYICGIATAFLGGLIGGFDIAVIALLEFMVVDIISGLCGTIINGDSKYGTGVSSSAMLKGGLRKGLMILLVILSVQLDNVLGLEAEQPVRTAVVFYLLATEGISIVENLGRCGVPLPSFIKKIFETMQDKNDKGEM